MSLGGSKSKVVCILPAKQFACKPRKIVCMRTKGQIVRDWRLAAGFETAGQLAAVVGTSRQNIENLEADAVDAPRYLPRLSKLMGYATVEELLELQEPPQGQGVPTIRAHPLSDRPDKLAPQEIQWEFIVESRDKLPAAFKVAAPDGAMSPRVRAGDVLGFETGLEPRAGDGILVRDGQGEPHFRMYRKARGSWEAYADNQPAYLTLTPEADGIEVIAVLVAVYGRWG